MENCVERAVILTRDERIDVGELFLSLRQGLHGPACGVFPSLADGERPLRTLKEIEKEAILDTLERLGGNQSRTALVLGIDRKTLRNKMKEYGLLRSGESE